jgi:type I restriction-modification system DNA methylase subunit
MVNIKTLLPDLKDLVAELFEDLLARAQQDDKIDAGLRTAFEQVEKGGRTAQAFEVWREDYLDQVAVAWVLACVFVRFMEDNHLIDECWLAGEKERRKLAEDTHELFFRKHPHDTDREYFHHVFHEVGKIPAASELFAEGKTPVWAVAPSGDAAMKLLAFWREIDAETGHLKRTFEVDEGDTRFLGDLYQELSEKAKKKYALLQTPVFVEEFILDRTLNPAIDEFGLEKVRLIDPTCGSGHFLLGAFARLFRLWMKRESNEIVAAQKALDGVWGVDINPFAVAIARFRLIVAAIQACGIKNLKRGHAPGWKIHLAAGDSLLFGTVLSATF